MHRYFHSAALTAAALALVFGEASDGLRLGIDIGPRDTLRLAIENKGQVQRNIALGSSTAQGAIYDFRFRVTAPDGKEQTLFNLNGPPGAAGKADPVIARILPGQTWDVFLPLNKFVTMEAGHEHPLTELLQKHYRVRAYVDTTPDARAERTRDQWTGRLRSGELLR